MYNNQQPTLTYIKLYSIEDFELLTMRPVPDSTCPRSKLLAVDFDQQSEATKTKRL